MKKMPNKNYLENLPIPTLTFSRVEIKNIIKSYIAVDTPEGVTSGDF